MAEKNEKEISSVEDYLTLSVKGTRDIDTLFLFLKRVMDNMRVPERGDDAGILLAALIDKFLYSVRDYIQIQDQEIERIHKLVTEHRQSKSLYEQRGRTRSNWIPFSLLIFPFLNLSFLQRKRESLYNEIYDQVARYYNLYCVVRDSGPNRLDLFDFYLPDISNKQQAHQLIDETIDLIQNDYTLSAAARKKIISYLKDALAELENPRTNWPNYFGKIKEIIIILGAVGSIVGGQCALNEAKSKLEQATEVIEKTCININYIALTNNQITGSSQTINVPQLPKASGQERNTEGVQEDEDTHPKKME